MPPEKHMIYYNLLDHLKQKGCPFCAVEASAAGHHLDLMLQEGVAQPDLRDQLREAHGYCRRHAAHWLTAGHPLDRALLYQDQVNLFADLLTLKKPLKRGRDARKMAEAWQKHKSCLACAAEDEAARRYLAVLFEQWAQPELQAALQAGPAFCPRHFFQALGLAPDQAARMRLLELEQGKLRILQSELEEFLRKLSLQANAAAFGQESDAWLRALRLMAGLTDDGATPLSSKPPSKPMRQPKKRA
jgi:hypothetical protein